MLTPLFLSFAKIGFGDDINTALLNPVIRVDAYKYQTLLGLIGCVVCLIPLFFYDLTEKKHADYVRVLKLRAAAENYNDGVLLDKDYINVKDIMDYARAQNDEFVLEEIGRHSCLDEIYGNSDEVIARVRSDEKQADMQELAGDIEIEFQRLAARLAKLKLKAEKRGKPFDEKNGA